MTIRARHQWERLAEHQYRCRACECRKTNLLVPGPWPDDAPRWVARFEWGGQRREGRTPPCPGHPPGQRAAAAASEPPVIPAAAALPAPVSSAAPGWLTLPEHRPRPVREVGPLLAGPADPAAEQYRAGLGTPRSARGGCGFCRHWEGAADRCRHPAAGPGGMPTEQARGPAGWPLAAGPDGSWLVPDFGSLADGAYREGGACGPGARLWEGRG